MNQIFAVNLLFEKSFIRNMSFLTAFPGEDKLTGAERLFELNGHIHSPYSFSAFSDIEQVFEMASKENIEAVGINDFIVTDGYKEFHDAALKKRVFPLFNIEFMGLLKEAQVNDLRINDPSNPGRIYFSGKGLDYPSKPDAVTAETLKSVRDEGNLQVSEMVVKLNEHLNALEIPIQLKYDEIKKVLAKELVRERHLARALRIAIFNAYSDTEVRASVIGKITGLAPDALDVENEAVLENLLRGKLLKSGGAAFVQENEKAFLELDEIIDVILKLGGIPCYPVLLDDPNGNITEFEGDYVKLARALELRNIKSIELIPTRNDFEVLKGFVNFFKDRNFVITFGTEHNTPELTPLKVSCRHGVPLDNDLKRISWEGAAVIAAHQYLRALGKEGYVNDQGIPNTDQYDRFVDLGSKVFNHYFNS